MHIIMCRGQVVCIKLAWWYRKHVLYVFSLYCIILNYLNSILWDKTAILLIPFDAFDAQYRTFYTTLSSAVQYIFQNFLSLVAIIRAKYEQTLHYACNKLSNIPIYVGQILFHFVVETHHCLFRNKYQVWYFLT